MAYHNTGSSNVAQPQVEVLQLSESSQRDLAAHQSMLLDLEAKKRAFQVDVPTLPKDVRIALRNMGLPVRLFGENLANVRDRLRLELARREILAEQQGGASAVKTEDDKRPKEEDKEETKYSRAVPELVQARASFATYSLARAQRRLQKERTYRDQWQRKRAKLSSSSIMQKDRPDSDTDFAEIERVDNECMSLYKVLRKVGLEGSQYGDTRPVSSISTSLNDIAGVPLVATGSWNKTIKLWDGSSPELSLVGQMKMAHEDRIMGMAVLPKEDASDTTLLATASIDLSGKIWKVQRADVAMKDDSASNDESSRLPLEITEMATLKGHAARLCKVAFHPRGDHVVTTSHDHTWRLWDAETAQELLLQDGHWKEVYGFGFHPDGSLCSSTDYSGVVQCWDLRTGKSICHFLGHAKRVTCAEFSPNGFQLATSGDDGTIKVWDLRKRKQFVSVPAANRTITQIQFDRHHGGEYLASSSFDGTAKLWSTRDWKMLGCGRGHEGMVMGVGLLKDSMVTCGFDKTLKLWK